MENKQLIEELYFCEAECKQFLKEYIAERENKKLKRCMMLAQECADICRVTAVVVERKSENSDEFLKLCAKICNYCAEECKKYNIDYCQKCAQVCSNCFEMCTRHIMEIKL